VRNGKRNGRRPGRSRLAGGLVRRVLPLKRQQRRPHAENAENAEEELSEKRQKKRSAAWPVTFSRRTCPPRVASETATTAASRGDAENAEEELREKRPRGLAGHI